MADPWFRREGDGLRSTGVAVSPHAADAQHGAAVAAVVARAVEAVPSAGPMDIVRLTVDLSKVVPSGLTTVRTDILRDGMRVQLVEAVICVDGVERTRSQALRLRRGDIVDAIDLPDRDEDPRAYDPTVVGGASPWSSQPILDGLEIRFDRWEPGAGEYWLRVSDQLVEGETMSPVTRAAVMADLVLTSGGMLPNYSVTNTDITLNLHRLPVGEWFRIDSTVYLQPAGWGSSIGTLYDEHGRFGVATKSLLVLGKVR